MYKPISNWKKKKGMVNKLPWLMNGEPIVVTILIDEPKNL